MRRGRGGQLGPGPVSDRGPGRMEAMGRVGAGRGRRGSVGLAERRPGGEDADTGTRAHPCRSFPPNVQELQGRWSAC